MYADASPVTKLKQAPLEEGEEEAACPRSSEVVSWDVYPCYCEGIRLSSEPPLMDSAGIILQYKKAASTKRIRIKINSPNLASESSEIWVEIGCKSENSRVHFDKKKSENRNPNLIRTDQIWSWRRRKLTTVRNANSMGFLSNYSLRVGPEG